MEMLDRLHDLETLLEEARSMPLSASCLVPREEALALLAQVRETLPESVADAELILRRRDDILSDANRAADLAVLTATEEAQGIVQRAEDRAQEIAMAGERAQERAATESARVLADARAQADLMVDSHSIAVAAHDEAARIIADAQERAERLLHETRERAARSLEKVGDVLRVGIDDLQRGVAALRVDVPQVQPASRLSVPAAAGPDAVFDIDAFGGVDGQVR